MTDNFMEGIVSGDSRKIPWELPEESPAPAKRDDRKPQQQPQGQNPNQRRRHRQRRHRGGGGQGGGQGQNQGRNQNQQQRQQQKPQQQGQRHGQNQQQRHGQKQQQRPQQKQQGQQQHQAQRHAPAVQLPPIPKGKMRVTFYGAAAEVGRSCILIESGNTRLILDAGIKLGETEEHPVIEDSMLKNVDAVILSHAHMDHSSYLPHFYSNGYNGPIYATKPTFELIDVMMKDYLHISNPKGVTKEGVKKIPKYYHPVEYFKEFRIKDIKVRLLPAGHIIGSAMIELDDGKHRLLYTGDVNLRSTKIFDPAYTKGLHDDALIIESTYGGKDDVFPPEGEVLGKMAQSIKETVNSGGRVILPCLAVGRAQEILFTLDDYVRSGVIPKVPIYVDGMIGKVLKIYKRNARFCKDSIQQRVRTKNNDPFTSKNFSLVSSRQERNRILKSDGSCIVVTTSGMLKGGPVIQYMDKWAGDSNNKVILVSYQAEDTPGRQLLNGAREIEFGDEKLKIKINLKVEYFHLSAHADRPQLLSLIGRVNGLKTIFIEHGEEVKAHELYDTLKNKYDAKLPVLSTPYDV
jgi:hypothetical protein